MKKHPPLKTDVLIVGAGPTGLTLANILGQSGVTTLLLDAKASTVTEPRAVSIDDESLRTMQAIGLKEEVIKDVVKGYGVHYFNRPGGICFGKVEPQTQIYGFPKRNAFRQPLFEATLYRGLSRFDSVTTKFSHKLLHFHQDESYVYALVETEDCSQRQIIADYMVGCDGGRSTVRKHLGIELSGSSFKSRWLVLDTEDDDDPFWQTRVYCDARRPVVDVPGPHHTRRYELMLHANESNEEMLTDEKIECLLQPFRGNKFTKITRKVVYTFHARVADKWQVGRIFIAGDAAHLTPPYAGQGMNSGIRDAHNLGWKLAAYYQGMLSQGALSSYETERRKHAWQLIQLALRLGSVMAPKNLLQASLACTFFRIVRHLPPVYHYFLQMRFKPKPRFTHGLVQSHGRCGRLRCGEMFPQPQLLIGGRLVLLDDVMGHRFALVQYATSKNVTLNKLTASLWDKLSAVKILILEPGANVSQNFQDDIIIAQDCEGVLSDYIGHPSEDVFLLRPDRYISAIVNKGNENDTCRSLSDRFEHPENLHPDILSSSRVHDGVKIDSVQKYIPR